MNRTAVACIAVTVLVALVHPTAAGSQTLNVHGQLSSWFILNDRSPSTPVLGLRYLPSVTLEKKLANERTVDGELSMNGYASAQAPDWRDPDATSKLKPYRLWARFKSSRFEARIGLQKINFGSASLLRPLMWFDSVDPRDPLQITDGVQAAVLRYYFPSNATVWTWGLYGNKRTKGWETSPARKNTPEFGGRVQVPLSKGELGFTTHHRRADLSKELVNNISLANPIAQEGRYALDGKWDLGIGLWFEGVLTHQINSALARPDQRALNVGTDYTFGIGNGLYVIGEYFILEQSRGVFGDGDGSRILAASLRYPVGLLDTISGIAYFDSRRNDAYRFVSWQRSYDRWQFYVMGFWNPEQGAIQQSASAQAVGQSPLSGRGFQIMAVFNH